MKNRSRKKRITDQEEAAAEDAENKSLIPKVMRSEVNFLVLPFFAIWDKDVRRRTKTEYTAVVERGNKKLEISWSVFSNPEFGYPGPFDKSVHKAIEQIINGLPFPIQNPISIGPFYSLCKRMEIDSGGAQYRKIKEALQRITFTGIVSKNALYSGKTKQWIEDSFHLYDRVVFKGMEMPNGETADTNYVYLNSWYLDNINAYYVKPVDWEYYRTLGTPVCQRLYELLSVKFYGLLMNNGEFILYKYSTLCDLLPIARQNFASNAKKVLEPAHEKLQETGFFEKWSWEDGSGQNEEKDWLIRYYPGRRAKKEIKRYGVGEQLEFELPPPNEAEGPIDESELSTADSEISEELMQRGITISSARKLVRDYSVDQIYKQIQIFDWLKETESQSIVTNAPGFLRKSIEENYQPPDGYITHLDKQTRRQEVEDRKERWLQHREKLIQQDISKWDTITPKERVQAMLDAWIFIQSRPSQNEIDSMQQELIDNLPKTDEEKREYIARNHPEDPPPDFE